MTELEQKIMEELNMQLGLLHKMSDGDIWGAVHGKYGKSVDRFLVEFRACVGFAEDLIGKEILVNGTTVRFRE